MIKPASSLCNLRCRYCFYHDLAANREVASYGIMRENTLKLILVRAFEALPAGKNNLSLIFQGGEPLLAGLAYFEKLEQLLSEMKRSDVLVNCCVQTNGTLINEEWARFFAKHRYLIGVSLDGNIDTHNFLRVDADGKGSYSAAKAGIDSLKKYGVEYNILTVVSAQIARHGMKTYSFFRKNGWNYLQFIPCMDPIDGQHFDFSLTPELYGRFLIETFGMYEQDILQGHRISVRWFDNLLDLAAGYMPESCGMTGICACHFVVEADGSVYPCDFYVDDAHRLGSVETDRFKDMFDTETARHFVEESLPQTEKCSNCRWFGLCRGGCRRYRDIQESGKLGLNRLCRAYEMFFDSCGARVVRLARMLDMRGGNV